MKEKEAEVFFERLLSDESGGRVAAARSLLGVNEKEAIRVLEEVVALQQGIVSFNAEMILQEWRAGRLIV